MTDRADQVVPAKCRHCDKPMSTPLVCDYCSTMNPSAVGVDYFTMLGLPRGFDLDEAELHRKYVALSRHAHPDFHATDTPEVRQLHLQVSATLNDAYQTLKDPAGRAAYLLALLGGASSAADKSVSDGFLQTMMMMQEELVDALNAGDGDELDRLRGVLTTQHRGLIRRLANLFDEHQQAIACRAVTTDILGEIRKQLNAISYVRKLLEQAGK